jgi:DNA repair exonuclease SbcCD nuclease subunit
MSKICILGDTHFGVRSDSRVFSDFFKKFYNEIFFPYLIKNNIKVIYQLGDLFDRRKYINFLTLTECKNYFFDIAQKNNIEVHTLVGNHDLFWRETVEINSPSLLLSNYKNITIYTKPTTVFIDNTSIDIIPWICKDNENEIYDFMIDSKSQICFGHFEIAGFQMYKGHENDEGISASVFSKYESVLSGHFHHRSTSGNITYVGTPAEHTWADFEDPRGFHIFDTGTRELDFIQNPFTIFSKIYYDDTKEISYNIEDFENKHLKLIVVNKTDYYAFDKFVEKIYKANPLELKIIEDLSEFEADAMGDQDVDLEDTVTLLSQYVDSLDTEADKTRIKTLMKTLYVEAQNYEEV